MNDAGDRGGGSADGPGAVAGPEQRSAAELMRAIGMDVVELTRKEIELAKQEIREGINARIKGIVALAVAGTMALFGLAFLAGALAWGLDELLQPWASRLIVGAAFLLVTALVAAAGLRQLRSAPLAPRRTRETIKEDVEWARAQLKR